MRPTAQVCVLTFSWSVNKKRYVICLTCAGVYGIAERRGDAREAAFPALTLTGVSHRLQLSERQVHLLRRLSHASVLMRLLRGTLSPSYMPDPTLLPS